MKTVATLSVAVLLCALFGTAQAAHAFDKQAVKKFKDSIVREMCEDGGEWMRCYKFEPYDCQSINTPIVDRCVDEVLSTVKSLERKQFMDWMAQDVYNCMKNDFKKQYGSRKLNTEECSG